MFFSNSGIKFLHLVDLDGAKAQKIVNYKVIELLASKTNLHIDFGGGLKSDQDLKIAFDCGANQITGGSIAVKNPEVFLSWIAKFGSDKIILGADVKNENVAISGWQETSELKINPFIQSYVQEGIKTIICTDVAKDGMLKGPSTELYERILKEFKSINLIASGGVSNISDLHKLKEIGCEGAIVGKAIYENKTPLKEIVKFI